METTIQTINRPLEKLLAQLQRNGIADARVLQAVAETPRHLFVDPALRYQAYDDVALPISDSQTISQPTVVARMSEVICARRSLKSVLEVGAGCGYQTMILSRLFSRVCTIERIRTLSFAARERLKALDVRNVEFQHGDGFLGWRERAPFDAIIVTAAVTEPPPLLISQMAADGIMVMPLGDQNSVQRLTVFKRVLGEQLVEEVGDVRFVPLLRGLSAGGQ